MAYINNRDMQWVGNMINRFRIAWDNPQLKPADIHHILQSMGFKPDKQGRYSTVAFHNALYGPYSERGREMAKEILHENKKMNNNKNIYITESQYSQLRESLNDYMYDPRKVKIVVKYLDDGFQRGNMAYIGGDGYPHDMKIVAMKGSDGSLLRNMTHNQLFYLLQDRFNKIFGEAEKRDKFLRDIITNWHNNAISKDGIIRVKKVK